MLAPKLSLYLSFSLSLYLYLSSGPINREEKKEEGQRDRGGIYPVLDLIEKIFLRRALPFAHFPSVLYTLGAVEQRRTPSSGARTRGRLNLLVVGRQVGRQVGRGRVTGVVTNNWHISLTASLWKFGNCSPGDPRPSSTPFAFQPAWKSKPRRNDAPSLFSASFNRVRDESNAYRANIPRISLYDSLFARLKCPIWKWPFKFSIKQIQAMSFSRAL